MQPTSRSSRLYSCVLILSTIVVLLLSVLSAQAQFTLVQVSVDKLQNPDSAHRSEVEPASYAWGSTIVYTYHVARRPGNIGWGSGAIGFSTSLDGGKTWHAGYLPDLTVNYKDGAYGAVADPSVAYDAKHNTWMISTLPLAGLNQNSGKIGDVAVSLSSDALHWSKPVLIDKTHLDDKNWTVCDNTPTSPFYGNCYTEWDQAFGNFEVLMSVSSDGGKTWGPGKPTADGAIGLGGEPLVQPNGTVIVPFQGSGINAFTSTDGGKTWGKSITIASIDSHLDAGNIRTGFDLPAAAMDGAGNVYVVWFDCRFRSGCPANDIVMSTSSDGTHWSSPARIPIDPVNSKIDHFLPGIGADPATGGTTAHLTIVFYAYSDTNCNTNTCKLYVGFVSSDDGGNTWSKGAPLAGPMQVTWLPNSDAGYMVADYIGVSYSNGNPYGVFAVAKPPNGAVLNEAMYTTKEPLLPAPDAPRLSSKGEEPVPNAKSDHVMIFYADDEGKRPRPASRTEGAPSNQH